MSTPSEKVSGPALSVSLSEQASRVLASLSVSDKKLLKELFTPINLDVRYSRISDMWDRQDVPYTYWVLLMTGIDQSDERNIAKELLCWQAFSAKAAARVQCIPSSDHDLFRLCASAWEVVDFPTLILSNSPDMESFVKLTPGLLFKLVNQEGAMPRFLTKVQRTLETRKSMKDVNSILQANAFWAGFQFAYKEIKDLLSFSVQVGH